MPARVSALAVAAVALAAVSCGSPHGSELDLLALFPFTEHGQEVREIDLGTPAAEPHLVSGWSQPDRLASGETVAWGIARRASLRFTIRAPAEARMTIRCGIPGAEPRRVVPVIVSLNNRRVAAMRLRPDLTEQTFRLPPIVQRAGSNELALASPFFSFAAFRAKRRVPGMACDTVRFEGINDEATPHATVVRADDGGTLMLPPTARVDFHLRLPASPALAFDLPQAGGLRVALQPERGGEVILHDGPTPAGPVRDDLSREAGQLVRLSFEGTGDAPLRIRQPRVIGPTPAPRAVGGAGRRSTPNILLYVVDTLRADHLGCYGYERPTSEHLDALAAQGILFARTIAQASWTTPATASILTGRYPIAHGALTLGEGMRQEVPTLAEVLRAAGYRTAGFVTNGNVTGSLGFRRGFDEYSYLPEDRSRRTVHLPGDELNAQVVSWLRKDSRGPFFLYVHASDPHAPYAPPGRVFDRFKRQDTPPPLAGQAEPVKAILDDPSLRTPENIAYLTDLYDAEIAFTDENVGQLLRAFEDFGLYRDSLIVVTADHGEELNDHGRFGHGHDLYGETTRVPLIVRLPEGRDAGRRVDAMARQIDLVPTLLDYLGIEPPAGVSGRSLLPLTDGAADADDGEAAFIDTRLGMPRRSAVVTATWKVIESATPQTRFEVYDLRADPSERQDLATTAPVVLGYGRQLLAEWAATTARVRYDPDRPLANPTMDMQTQRRLEALGYVDGQKERQ